MSDITFSTRSAASSGTGPGWTAQAKGLAGSALALVWLMLARSRERQLLASLDARGLRDIGLAREEAAREARKWFWQG